MWAFTRSDEGTYVLAAGCTVSTIEKQKEWDYGQFRLIPEPGSTTYFDIAHGLNAESVIRSLSISANAEVLGQSFQGNSAARRISASDNALLEEFASRLPRLRIGTWKTEFSALEDLSAEELTAVARYRGLPIDPTKGSEDSVRARMITALRNVPTPSGQRTKFSGKRVVRAAEWRNGGNPRRAGSHGFNAYELILLDDFGINAGDLLARIQLLPPKSSEASGAGGTNHLQWDLDHGFTKLIDDPGPPVPGAGGELSGNASDVEAPRRAADIGPAGRIQIQTSRIVRDTEVVRWLKKLYANSCQICRRPLKAESGWTYSEGHHLKPLGAPHLGPDVAGNILIVCPNHHALCDFGAISVVMDDLLIHPQHELTSIYVDYHNHTVVRRDGSA